MKDRSVNVIVTLSENSIKPFTYALPEVYIMFTILSMFTYGALIFKTT
jgi:hypothetical protein